MTLVDRHNFFLFQPLVYQVATGALSPGEIASQLGLTTSLTPLLQAMAQEGLVERVTAETYRRLPR